MPVRLQLLFTSTCKSMFIVMLMVLQGRLAGRARGAGAAAAGGAEAGGACAAPPAAYSAMDVDGETDSNHDTALTLACAGGHEELVELLLSRGADIEHRDKKVITRNYHHHHHKKAA